MAGFEDTTQNSIPPRLLLRNKEAGAGRTRVIARVEQTGSVDAPDSGGFRERRTDARLANSRLSAVCSREVSVRAAQRREKESEAREKEKKGKRNESGMKEPPFAPLATLPRSLSLLPKNDHGASLSRDFSLHSPPLFLSRFLGALHLACASRSHSRRKTVRRHVLPANSVRIYMCEMCNGVGGQEWSHANDGPPLEISTLRRVLSLAAILQYAKIIIRYCHFLRLWIYDSATCTMCSEMYGCRKF